MARRTVKNITFNVHSLCRDIYTRNTCTLVKSPRWLLLDVDFVAFNGYVLITGAFIPAHPHLDAVGGWLWQLLVEPRRVVEGATRALATAASTLPQRIGRVQDVAVQHVLPTCVTEVQ